MLNVGIIGVWHVHTDGYVRELQKSGKVALRAVWDEDEAVGRKWAEENGVEFVKDYDAFLARADIEAVLCNAPTTTHEALLVKAAAAGKHIFTEKLLATTTAAGEAIVKAIEAAGVTCMVSLPLLSDWKILYTKKLIEEGVLGRLSGARMRRSHTGVSDHWLPDRWYDVGKTGGGALMDLGAHPVYVLTYLLGKPQRVSGMLTNQYGTTSDENAVALVEYEGGIIGMCETAFVTFGVPDLLEVYGSEGSIFIWGDEVKVSTREMAKQGLAGGTPVRPAPSEPSPLMQFVDVCLDKGAVPERFSAQSALTMTRIIEAAYASDRAGQTVKL